VLAAGSLGFGEAYVDGWWDCTALDAMICRVLRAHVPERIHTTLRTAKAWAASCVRNLQTRRRARIVGRRHYDLGNDFFAAMLDPAMQYSCAWFHETDDLAEAQQQKLELICRKLDLHPGQRLLDIGCGWGGLAKFAAEHHGCSVVGITISREQQRFAAESCRGLPVEIRLQDYRDVRDTFDRVVSVGMMEHVGCKNYRRYMETAAHCLHADGDIFLCHTIGGTTSRRWTDPWMARYIFPNSMVPSPAQVTRAAEGLFVLEDVHNFGAHYDRTLLAWEGNVRRAWPRFRERYGERFLRMWRYYLLSAAGTFRARDIELYQFVFAKGGVPGGYESVRAWHPESAIYSNSDLLIAP
jgi:cyclopropane-fatty-acyl-phospholipid synthase